VSTFSAGAARGIEISSVIVEPDGRALAELAELIAAGTLDVSIAATFPLGDAPSRQQSGAERSCFAPDANAAGGSTFCHRSQ